MVTKKDGRRRFNAYCQQGGISKNYYIFRSETNFTYIYKCNVKHVQPNKINDIV